MSEPRWRLVGAGVAVLIACAGCDRTPTEPTLGTPYPPSTSPYRYFGCDRALDWSMDGRSLLFRRVVPSQDGPPGLYIVDVRGGAPRFLTPADYFFPGGAKLSPDGRWIAASMGDQLVRIEVATGRMERLLYTGNGVAYTAWSPDGSRIAYSHVFADGDSIGIQIYSLDGGRDSSMAAGLNGANEILWAPTEQLYYQTWSDGWPCIEAFDPATGARRVVYGPFRYTTLRSLQWYAPARSVKPGILFREVHQYPLEYFGMWMLLDPETGRACPFTELGADQVFSPSGREVAYTHFSPGDSAGVIFVCPARSPDSPACRQLTWCYPPQPGLAEPWRAAPAPIGSTFRAPPHLGLSQPHRARAPRTSRPPTSPHRPLGGASPASHLGAGSPDNPLAAPPPAATVVACVPPCSRSLPCSSPPAPPSVGPPTGPRCAR